MTYNTTLTRQSTILSTTKSIVGNDKFSGENIYDIFYAAYSELNNEMMENTHKTNKKVFQKQHKTNTLIIDANMCLKHRQ